MRAALLILLCCCFARVQAQDTISWQPAYKLQWNDFQGTINRKVPYKAATSAGLNYTFTVHRNEQVSFRVSCVFYKKRSWVKIKSDSLLAHEQGHFDIAEIFARQLRRAFQSYTLKTATVAKDLERLWQKMVAEKDALSNRYDRETYFGEDSTAQAAWADRIANQLQSLDKWAAAESE